MGEDIYGAGNFVLLAQSGHPNGLNQCLLLPQSGHERFRIAAAQTISPTANPCCNAAELAWS
jgi:hypothetical protein